MNMKQMSLIVLVTVSTLFMSSLSNMLIDKTDLLIQPWILELGDIGMWGLAISTILVILLINFILWGDIRKIFMR